MDRKLSDEQIDRLAKNLLQDFALSDEALDEIAAAPRLWWNVRSRIETEKTRREKYRFGWFRPQNLAFGALAILICGAAAILFLSFAKNPDSIAALENKIENQTPPTAQIPENSPAVSSPEIGLRTPENPKPQSPGKVSLKNAAPRAGFVAKVRKSENSAKQTSRPSKRAFTPETTAAETKTDFIALSYAANSESGQIVRVKVPSSMMVSLGVKTEVEDGAELVNAEVVIGDDGLARAIRFIR